jgi:phosphosulfolactate synthase
MMNSSQNEKMAFDCLKSLPRQQKPRENGLTFTGDRGRTLNEIREFVDCGGDFVDMIKLSMTTACLQSREKVKDKVALYRANNIDVFPGGMMTELALLQNVLVPYLEESVALGFNVLEVSATDTCIPLNSRIKVIKLAKERYEFKILGELGMHFQKTEPSVPQTIFEAQALLDAGAWKVIIEGCALGATNDVRTLLYPVVSKIGLDNLIFETHTPYDLIKEFGPEINIGNAGDIHNIWYIELSRRGISPEVWFGDMAIVF